MKRNFFRTLHHHPRIRDCNLPRAPPPSSSAYLTFTVPRHLSRGFRESALGKT